VKSNDILQASVQINLIGKDLDLLLNN